MKSPYFSILIALAFGSAKTLIADVKLPSFISDHLVLQQQSNVPVWGWAKEGEEVVVEFAGQKKTAKTDAAGKWRVMLDPLAASAEPREMKIGGRVLKDVLVGEVWLASGQSNMGFPLSAAHNAEQALAAAGER